MVAKIAVSAANFAIDKPYSYLIPEEMVLGPGQRVQVPFGRGNRRSEGIVLAVGDGVQSGLKSVERSLDAQPILTENQLRLAAFLRERYFCTFYDAVRAMLPAGLWFQTQESFSLTDNRDWKTAGIQKERAREILEYLEGNRKEFTFPISPAGTSFQTAVWEALRHIPYGQTQTYGQIAAAIGRPGAARAVGQAANRNPIWIVIPCHRVIGSNGSLTGYAGGTELKQSLLELEKSHT